MLDWAQSLALLNAESLTADLVAATLNIAEHAEAAPPLQLAAHKALEEDSTETPAHTRRRVRRRDEK